MTPTPVTFASPTAPAGYSWEATDEQVAARYGTPVTLEDLPSEVSSERVMLNARNETASEVLRRNLHGRKLNVTVSGAGVLVTGKEESAP